jgi:hypothetical protein
MIPQILMIIGDRLSLMAKVSEARLLDPNASN